MKSYKKLLACGLTLAMMAGMTACTDEVEPNPNSGGTAPSTTSGTTAPASSADPNDNAATDEKAKDIDTST